ncbi:hypothetical protein GN244_ATG04262 [Phytophthora infestans]|uniref:Uncharacterized protein n=1 Tax=Phytophthora infestans TaxID=4787 RepID=A0A833S9G8_PHYIN|nr:hypothetical protein GN244_ATG04262 [Phytophthora infestans]KAF4144952.1 hypothetical protein GN958_ATG05881 [Phytophthora infestans]
MEEREFPFVKRPVQGAISAILKDSNGYLNVRDEDRDVRRSRPLNFPELDEAYTPVSGAPKHVGRKHY